jgi:hypothetical protein
MNLPQQQPNLPQTPPGNSAPQRVATTVALVVKAIVVITAYTTVGIVVLLTSFLAVMTVLWLVSLVLAALGTMQ